MTIDAPASRSKNLASPKNLVVVRAGNNSLHHDWLKAGWEDRNFDLVISYFSPEAFAAHEPREGVCALLVKGGKWDGLYKSFLELPDWRDYDYFWLPDDDIATTTPDISSIFNIARQYEARVCQPSLTPNSYYSHLIFMHSASFLLRYSNYIEIMVPCLDRRTLEIMLPHFADTQSGYGMDGIWCRLEADNRNRAFIIDSIQVHHTRPVGGELQKNMARTGTRMDHEYDLMADAFGLKEKIMTLCYGGIGIDGQTVHGRMQTGLRMYFDERRDLGRYHDRAKAKKRMWRLLKRHFTKPIKLQQLFPSSPVDAKGS
ncbi:MAG: hypothetical protein AAGC58_00335 [Asticcacaulis sp.]